MGVQVQSDGTITAGVGGTVTVLGIGGLGTGGYNYGVDIESNPGIISSSGNIDVTGQGGSSALSPGVLVSPSGSITAGNNASVTVHGTGRSSSGGHGVWLNGTITSSDGNVNVTGQGNGISGGWEYFFSPAGQLVLVVAEL